MIHDSGAAFDTSGGVTHAHIARVRRSSGLASAANFRTSHLSADARTVDEQHNQKGERTAIFCVNFSKRKKVRTLVFL